MHSALLRHAAAHSLSESVPGAGDSGLRLQELKEEVNILLQTREALTEF